MIVDISLINEIKDAIAYDSASTFGWAEARMKEMKAALLKGEQLIIKDGESKTVLNTFDDLLAYKSNDPHLSFINLIEPKDLPERQVINDTLNMIRIKEILSYIYGKEMLRQVYTDVNNIVRSVNFHSTRYHNFPERISDVAHIWFRLGEQYEIGKNIADEIPDINEYFVFRVFIQTQDEKIIEPIIIFKSMELAGA